VQTSDIILAMEGSIAMKLKKGVSNLHAHYSLDKTKDNLNDSNWLLFVALLVIPILTFSLMMTYLLYWSCTVTSFQVPGVPAMASYVDSILDQSNIYYCGVTGSKNNEWNACSLPYTTYLNSYYCKSLKDAEVNPPDDDAAPPTCFEADSTVYTEVAVFYTICTDTAVAFTSSVQLAAISMSFVWIIFTLMSNYVLKQDPMARKLSELDSV
jgi:hypothetical protein